MPKHSPADSSFEQDILSGPMCRSNTDPAPCDQTDGRDALRNVARDLPTPENLGGYLFLR